MGDVCLTSLNERVMSVVFKSRSSTAQNPHDVTWKVNQSLNRLRVDAFFFFFFQISFPTFFHLAPVRSYPPPSFLSIGSYAIFLFFKSKVSHLVTFRNKLLVTDFMIKAKLGC